MDDKNTTPEANQSITVEPTPSTPATATPIWVDTISESTLSNGLDSDIKNANG